jgi:uncharacterized membrane protein
VKSEPFFRWRGRDVSRVEALSDAVFGFAVTLLVVSLEVPRTYADLLHVMAGIPAFAITFWILLIIWLRQYKFFRRFGLDDSRTTMLNFALLFVVLVYVYPLKFLFASAFSLTSEFYTGSMTAAQVAGLYAIYSAGYVAQQLIFMALYSNALAQREHLDLTPREQYEAGTEIAVSLVASLCAAVVPVAALAVPPALAASAGMLYWILPAGVGLTTAWRKRTAPAA